MGLEIILPNTDWSAKTYSRDTLFRMASQFSLGFDDLACFVRVAEHGSFTRAAAALAVRKATVSRHIQQLEERLGAQLLVRTTRAVRLTEEGRAYLAHAKVALGAADDAVRAIAAIRDAPTGVLRIATLPYLGDVVLAPLVLDYARRYPNVALALSLGHDPVELLAGGFDLALCFGKPRDGDLICRRVGRGGQGCYASPAYLATAGTPRTPRDLSSHPIVALGTGPSPTVAWTFHRGGERQLVTLRPRLKSLSPVLSAQAARAGLGVARLPRVVARPLLAAGELLRVLADWDGAAAPLYLFMPRQRQVPTRTRAFIDLMTRAVAAGQFGRDLAGDDGD